VRDPGPGLADPRRCANNWIVRSTSGRVPQAFGMTYREQQDLLMAVVGGEPNLISRRWICCGPKAFLDSGHRRGRTLKKWFGFLE